MGTSEAGIIDTRSLGEQVYEYLCNKIIEGTLNYGKTLSIKNLAAQLNVSPMPVREAIKRLEIEGIVTIRPRSSCLIKIPTKKSIVDALLMREILEIHCIESLYKSIAKESLAPLRIIIDAMRRIVKIGHGPDEIKEYIRYDRDFHMGLCRLADNEFIDKFYREVSLHLNMNFIYDISIPPDIVTTLSHHTDIVDALADNSSAAVDVMKEHLLISRNNVLTGRIFSSLEGRPDAPQSI